MKNLVKLSLRLIKLIAIGYLLFIALSFLFFNSYRVLNRSVVAPIPTGSTADVGVFVVTLDRFKDRYEQSLPYITGLALPIHKINYPDSKKMSDEEIRAATDSDTTVRLRGCPLNKSEVGASLGHMEALKAFLRSDYEFALIFEDDVKFDPATLKQVVEELTLDTRDWDVVRFQVHRSVPYLTLRQLRTHQLVTYLRLAWDCGAYLITRDAAHKMVHAMHPLILVIDHYFLRAWELGLRMTAVEPLIVQQTSKQLDHKCHMGIDAIRSHIARESYSFQIRAGILADSLKQYFKSKLAR